MRQQPRGRRRRGGDQNSVIAEVFATADSESLGGAVDAADKGIHKNPSPGLFRQGLVEVGVATAEGIKYRGPVLGPCAGPGTGGTQRPGIEKRLHRCRKRGGTVVQDLGEGRNGGAQSQIIGRAGIDPAQHCGD